MVLATILLTLPDGGSKLLTASWLKHCPSGPIPGFQVDFITSGTVGEGYEGYASMLFV